MFRQTIALFRYQLVGIVNRRLALLLLAIVSAGFLLSRFVAELAIINSETIALSALADFLRYALVLVMVITLSYQVAQDYEARQFDRLLAMPLSRWQYLVAQWLVMFFFAFLLALPVGLLLWWLAGSPLALYWSVALLLELLLVGQFALLAILSLEKLPLAVMLSLTLYLLAKAAPIIAVILAQSSPFYDQEQSFRLASTLFSALQYLLPDASAFAQNDLLSAPQGLLGELGRQWISVIVYSIFLQLIILFDFYRKEFN